MYFFHLMIRNIQKTDITARTVCFLPVTITILLTDVKMNDRGLYSCNLHHVYCNLHETTRIQLNVTKSSTDLCQTESWFTAVLLPKSPLWYLAFSPRRTQAAELLGRTESGVRGAPRDHRSVALHQQTERLDRLEQPGGGSAGEWIKKVYGSNFLVVLLRYIDSRSCNLSRLSTGTVSPQESNMTRPIG